MGKLAVLITLLGLSSFGKSAVASEPYMEAQGNFMVRILGAAVLPDSSAVTSVVGGNAEVSDAYIPAATLTYFLTPNIAAELFCCVAQHQVDGRGTLAASGEIADTWIFPPTVTLQYHFADMGNFKPYLGAGVTWIHFFDMNAGDLAPVTVNIDDAFGFALQAGVDISIGGNWNLNLDVKKIFISTDVEWSNGITADLEIDPLIVSVGLGYRFNLGDLFGSRSAPLN